MSASGGAGPGGNYNPVPRLTLKQFKEYASFFKELLSDNPLVKWSIVIAGVGGLFETIHILWLFGVWAYWKLAH
jgi:hypothetical protein